MTITEIEPIPAPGPVVLAICPKAQTIFALGVMGYRPHPAPPGATFAMEKAQALATLVTDAELQHELTSLTFWDRLRRG